MDPSASPSTPPPETPAPAAPEEPVDSSTQLQFTVLYGAHSSAGACCYMLEIAGCVILLDCGWDESWDPALLEPLERVAQDVRLIIVSHADIEHAGALPYAYKKFKLNAQCYVTSPVLRLCHLALYDAVLSGGALYTLDDVDQAMGFLHELKYQQPLELQLGAGKESIKVIPHAAGRTLGGAGGCGSGAGGELTPGRGEERTQYGECHRSRA
jgi:cleavage and polyadenylation specificity factor subunit 2